MNKYFRKGAREGKRDGEKGIISNEIAEFTQTFDHFANMEMIVLKMAISMQTMHERPSQIHL